MASLVSSSFTLPSSKVDHLSSRSQKQYFLHFFLPKKTNQSLHRSRLNLKVKCVVVGNGLFTQTSQEVRRIVPENRDGLPTVKIVHEIVGVVTEVGSKVQKFKAGDKVGVGCMVESCRACDSCASDLENYCPNFVLTYSAKNIDGTMAYGGYSNSMVADEHFIVRIPDSLPLASSARIFSKEH